MLNRRNFLKRASFTTFGILSPKLKIEEKKETQPIVNYGIFEIKNKSPKVFEGEIQVRTKDECCCYEFKIPGVQHTPDPTVPSPVWENSNIKIFIEKHLVWEGSPIWNEETGKFKPFYLG